MIFRPDRSPERPVKHLGWRLYLFGAAAVLAGLGIHFDIGWLVWGAIVLLVAGLLIRFLPEADEEAGDEPRTG